LVGEVVEVVPTGRRYRRGEGHVVRSNNGWNQNVVSVQ
jgi:hypothetical protein